MRVLRTPEDRFAGLTDFGYPPRYAQVPDGEGGSLRMAYVADGPDDGPVVLLLHGEPTWSYLYRKVIPPLAARGLRAVAVDLVGFGRSDKPAEIGAHSYARQVEWVRSLVFDTLDLREVTLVGQDWGGLIGLRLATENADRIARVVAANTGLPTGDAPMPEVWWQFARGVEADPDFDLGALVAAGCRQPLAETARAAYRAPFPDRAHRAGPLAMPRLVPTSPDDPANAANRVAWQRLAGWHKPFLVAFSDGDPITGPAAGPLRQAVPGAAGLDHPVVSGAGHFLQEDAGERLGQIIAGFVP
ncbi:MAG TPA: haloalkane dehalogenase [Mycobacteriales bacterium]|nr:haloalkane dehalogenase [Mycobacteriales bacterium]